MRIGTLFLVAISLFLSACSAPKRAQPRTAEQPAFPPEPYVRIDNTDSNLVQLQIAVRKFMPARNKGPAVWLVGVSHIGASNYYAVLQRHLDAQTLVLFEGIGAHPSSAAEMAEDENRSAPRSDPGAEAASTQGGNSSLQSSMAASLGLVFQLEAVDYRRPHFHNSDLSVQQLRQILADQRAGPGQPDAGQSFESLLEIMQGGSLLDALLQLGLRFLGASPRLQAMGKLMLMDAIDQIQGDPAQLHGLPPHLKQLLQVLIEKRDQKVITDLEAALKPVGRRGSIAIFYGAGHMPDFEKRLRNELNYRPAEQLWLTAFSVDLTRAGVSEAERQFLRTLVKGQLSAAK